jgi:superfamily II DNA or RNA helicase
VLSEAGRREIDAHHRHYMYRFPTAPRAVVSAPPGAGKTTAIIEMMRRWQKRALVITFNKAAQETIQQRIREAGLTTMAHARTIDSLCYETCSQPSLMKWSDWELCNEF